MRPVSENKDDVQCLAELDASCFPIIAVDYIYLYLDSAPDISSCRQPWSLIPGFYILSCLLCLVFVPGFPTFAFRLHHILLLSEILSSQKALVLVPYFDSLITSSILRLAGQNLSRLSSWLKLSLNNRQEHLHPSCDKLSHTCATCFYQVWELVEAGSLYTLLSGIFSIEHNTINFENGTSALLHSFRGKLEAGWRKKKCNNGH